MFLIRQYIYELLHYLVYDRYGVGWLKKRYSKDVRDRFGNSKPPLLYTVIIFESSRNSSSSDMVAFEVETASIAVSYIQESFAMPTESTPFVASPGPEYELPQSDRCNLGSCDAYRRNSHLSISDSHDCIDDSSTEDSQDPISSHDSSKLKRRLTILLKHIRLLRTGQQYHIYG